MKNLNLKFGLFSLLLLFAVSVFMTSCSKEKIVEPSDGLTDEEIQEEAAKMLSDEPFILPYGFDLLSEEEVSGYFENMTGETHKDLIEHRRVAFFLHSIDVKESVTNNMNTGDLFNRTNLEEYLTPNQVQSLRSYKIEDDIQVRGCCGSWYTNSSRKSVVKTINGCCYRYYYKGQSRNCSWACPWAAEFRWKYRYRVRC